MNADNVYLLVPPKDVGNTRVFGSIAAVTEFLAEHDLDDRGAISHDPSECPVFWRDGTLDSVYMRRPVRQASAQEEQTEALTSAMIRTLKMDALAVGNAERVAICNRALHGDRDARQACASILNESRARIDVGSPKVKA